MDLTKIIFLLIFAHDIKYLCGYKILSLLPFAIKSHYRIFDSIMVELARRGHNVTVINPYPKSIKIPNYTEIDLSVCLEKDIYSFPVDETYEMVNDMSKLIAEVYQYVDDDKRILNCEPIKNLLKSNEQYDLLMMELFFSDSFLPFINKFRVPLVVLCANVLTPWAADRMGEPDNPSYLPVVFNNYVMNPKNPTFYERLTNVYIYVAYKIIFYLILQPKSQKFAREYIDPSTDELSNIAKNTSLILSYSYFGINVPRPHLPNVKEIGGIHICEAQQLDKDINEFIEGSKYGVIYFSMGSLLQGKSFPREKRNTFVRVFSKLPQRILWKWEDVFPEKPENVKILKWMPQRDILAHPKVKLFISHGGSLGINEAVYEGVPVLGIPIYADQMINLMMIKLAGAAEILEYNSISDEILYEKLQLLLNDTRYTENAKTLSAQYKDRPMSPMDTAMYWIEYVIRHKGAQHLRSVSADLPWYQYLLLDVILFITITLISAVIILYYTCKFLIIFTLHKIKIQYDDKRKQN